MSATGSPPGGAHAEAPPTKGRAATMAWVPRPTWTKRTRETPRESGMPRSIILPVNKAVRILLLLLVSFAVYFIYFQHIHFGVEWVDHILQSQLLPEIAGSFLVIPIVYLVIESAIDREFMENLEKQLRMFMSDPATIIPSIDSTKLDSFTSTLLRQYFPNRTLADAFVGVINNYKSRLHQPIEDYRIFVDLYQHDDKYFKIDVAVTSALRKGRGGNVKIACAKREGNVFEVDPYAEECDFLWNFVPYAPDSPIDELEFSLHGVTLDGQEVKMSAASRGGGRIEYTSEQTIDPDKHPDAIFGIQFSVLQRKGLSGLSVGMSRPAKELSVQLNYRDLDVDDISVWSFLVGSQTMQPLIENNKVQRRFVVRYKGWVMNGSGVVFTWRYKGDTLEEAGKANHSVSPAEDAGGANRTEATIS